ncbi:hypothetical protein RRG08_035440 [Elysia crispata]|uniref:Uncharacterized protein n=1 Tax=Elysia crispata TaxID=231223 RepID=A0AAE0Y4J6_9GAST|nr:hypothetical protein RRG08_035440 [Elysia crispata]
MNAPPTTMTRRKQNAPKRLNSEYNFPYLFQSCGIPREVPVCASKVYNFNIPIHQRFLFSSHYFQDGHNFSN